MIIDINKSIVSIEKILKIKKDWEDKGFVKFPQNFDFKGAYMELLQWFDWDIKKYRYVSIVRDESVSLYPENIHIKLEKDYSLMVLLAMVILYCCENEVLISNSNLGKINSFITNACGCQYFVDKDSAKLYYYLEDNNIYHNDNSIHGNTASFVCGMIHNRMQNNDFEAFYKEFKSIIQKHILKSLTDGSSIITTPIDVPVNDDIIETTVTPVDESIVTNQPQVIPPVALTYHLNYSVDPYAKIKAKFGFVPLAYVALEHNPVGCWFYDNQLGIYRSQFVDYHKLNCMADKVTARKYIESITKIMSNPIVYEEILQYMPVIGTKFKDTEPVLLKFISGSSIYSTKYVIGCEYGEHSLIFVCDVITNTINADYFGKTADVSIAVNNFRV